jgi:hypothetical protein
MGNEGTAHCWFNKASWGCKTMTMILIESFDLENLREYECMVCLEKTPIALGEKWQICANCHFTKTKTLEGSAGRTLAPVSANRHQ